MFEDVIYDLDCAIDCVSLIEENEDLRRFCYHEHSYIKDALMLLRSAKNELKEREENIWV